MPNYCARDYGVIRLIYGRKIAVFSSFSDRKSPVNDAVLINLGYYDHELCQAYARYRQSQDISTVEPLLVNTSRLNASLAAPPPADQFLL